MMEQGNDGMVSLSHEQIWGVPTPDEEHSGRAVRWCGRCRYFVPGEMPAVGWCIREIPRGRRPAYPERNPNAAGCAHWAP